MHPALEQLTPREAQDLINSPLHLQQWINGAGLPYREAIELIFDRADEALDAPPPPEDPRRRDRDRLIAFVELAEGLPLRLRQVARLCLEDGLTLRECGAHLGITRETVRVHLRRLRAIERQHRQRVAAANTRFEW